MGNCNESCVNMARYDIVHTYDGTILSTSEYVCMQGFNRPHICTTSWYYRRDRLLYKITKRLHYAQAHCTILEQWDVMQKDINGIPKLMRYVKHWPTYEWGQVANISMYNIIVHNSTRIEYSPDRMEPVHCNSGFTYGFMCKSIYCGYAIWDLIMVQPDYFEAPI